MSNSFMICSDLDRTILPNGPQKESSQARPLLRKLTEQPGMILAYVTGRDLNLLKQAIEEFDLPIPDYAIGDVGTTLYENVEGEWKVSEDWSREIAQDWNGWSHDQLVELLSDIRVLELQEEEKQNTFKVSYYADPYTDYKKLIQMIQERLQGKGIRASLIWSVDEQSETGLLDVLPENATKLHAVRFLIQKTGLPREKVVYSGDSGNDLPALTSELQAVLVKNARDEVRKEAVADSRKKGREDLLYVAQGDFLGMNGNYTAGVLEGAAHYLPEVRSLLEKLASHSPE